MVRRVRPQVWLLVSVIAVAMSSPAASAADPRDEARAKLRAGVGLMERGDYAGALAAFESAYALVPNPKIQFNIATAYDALARHAAAYDAFALFLADPKDAPAETVAKARASVAALEKKVGRIVVTSDQADDQVFVDGRPRGATPLAKPIVVDAGAHAVTVRRGAAQFAENVSLAEGEERPVAARFAPPIAAAPEPALVAPSPMVAKATPDPIAPLAISREPAPPEPPAPFYRRAWFWTVVAGGLTAVAVTGVLVFRPTDYPPADSTVTIPMPLP